MPVKDALIPLVSGRVEDLDAGALFIHQDAALHGGRLEIASKLGQGTTTTILLPLGHAKGGESGDGLGQNPAVTAA